ncbi:MAG TPA: TraR/DksA family transcriptional regulator [Candidatus Polarisedimenticolaceae bacterium]|nr:TraR/DksA family transcriptional regulator [Candidatus Polarisedimenticolaceae bacterium]
MKAKPSKVKTAPAKAGKVMAKKVAPAKPAALKAAPKKAAAPKAPVKPVAAKASAKPVVKAGAKGAPVKPPAKVAGKIVPKIAVKVPKFGSKKEAAAPAEAPRAPIRRIPKPASVAARRKEAAHFREILLRKRQQLMHAYSISKGDSQSDLDNGTEDYVDYAVNSYAREFLLSLTELDRKQLLMVEEALNRIDRGEFGYCQQCGEEINKKRLEVQPWARHCVRCQELEEKGILPQYPTAGGEDEEFAEEPEEAAPAEEEAEAEAEVEDDALEDEPLVVDGDDSEE